MVERERMAEAEAMMVGQEMQPIWDANLIWKYAPKRRMDEGRIIIKGKQIPHILLPQGYIRFYLLPPMEDIATDIMVMFSQTIPKQSGRHVHQGGFGLFVLEGKGYTVVDSVRYDWKAGDLILLPVKKGGCEHQHFNLDSKPSRWLALQCRPFWEITGQYTHQKETSPFWKELHGDGFTEYMAPNLSAEDQSPGRKIEIQEGNLWDELFKIQDEQRDRLSTTRAVVRFDDIPWELNRQGKMKWYLHPRIEDTAHKQLMVYVQEIPPGGRSGKIQHQGGSAFYVWQGSGYSIINGKRYDWEDEDVILLPINVDWNRGIIYQHFNTDRWRPAHLLQVAPNVVDNIGVDLGVGLEQLEDCPEFVAEGK